MDREEELERTIVVTDEKGNEQEGLIIFSFEANGDEFVLYEIDETAYAAKIGDDGDLKPVEEDEWKLVEKIYTEYMEDLENDEDFEDKDLEDGEEDE